MKACILGDVSPTIVTNPLFQQQKIDALFHDTPRLFHGNDFNFVNLECALTEAEDDIEKYGPALKGCRETAQCLQKIGVNICGLSNNHVYDYGSKGAVDTINALDEAEILHTGFGSNYEGSRENLVIEKGGEKVCLIAVCEHEYSYALEDRMGSRPYDEYDTMDDIREAKKAADRVIVIYHGGKEFCRYPSPRLRKLCRSMVKNGADVVICQHSHCIGCYEEFEGSHILYGQGNFHFVKPDLQVDLGLWHECLAVQYDTVTNHIEFIPVVVKDDGVAIAADDKAAQIMRDFYRRCDELKDGQWKKHWHAFCESLRAPYTAAAQAAAGKHGFEINQSRFAHYLDCEAHTDVWRELFFTTNRTNK